MYWLIGVPTDRDISFTRSKLQESTRSSASVFDFRFPRLKVGTLDDLMQLSDDLGKMDSVCEGTVKKIKRSYHEVIANKPRRDSKQPAKKGKDYVLPELKCREDGVSVNECLETFAWNDSQYPPVASINDLSESIMKKVQKAEDELKNQLSAYNETRSTLDGIVRKESGTLLVKPLSEYVQQESLVDSINLFTLLLVIPKKSEKQFVETYENLEDTDMAKEIIKSEKKALDAEKKRHMEEQAEREGGEEQANKSEEIQNDDEDEMMKKRDMCGNIVPSSARKLAEDEEFVLYSVLVFKKALEFVKRLMRAERYTVRAYKFDATEETRRKQTKKEVKKKMSERYNHLCAWSKTMFGDVYISWLHIKAMRCFVESVLRYGLPVDFQAFVVHANGSSKDKTTRASLEKLYKHLADPNASGNGNEAEDKALSQYGDFFPYVSLNVDLALE